jgi:uncharacterized membrane protein YebE (DUF533 family)
MNSDEIKSLIVKVLIMVLTPIATKYGIDGDAVASGAAAVASLAVLGYGIYDHWNMKKVPETAQVIPVRPDPGIAGQR